MDWGKLGTEKLGNQGTGELMKSGAWGSGESPIGMFRRSRLLPSTGSSVSHCLALCQTMNDFTASLPEMMMIIDELMNVLNYTSVTRTSIFEMLKNVSSRA